MVWKPLGGSEQQNSLRRYQQRVYVDFLGVAMNGNNGSNGANGTIVTYGSNGNTGMLRSDAILYIEQHLDKVENYLKEQHADGFNNQHYKNLLLRIKKIREKYESDVRSH